LQSHTDSQWIKLKQHEERQLVDTELSEITSESWENAIGHIVREELRTWELDGLSDTVVERYDETSATTASLASQALTPISREYSTI
jgi:hypothetical protein